MQVALIFGVTGGLRKADLCDITTKDIQDCGSHILITVPKTKTHSQGKFIVDGEFYYGMFKKYEALRPKNTTTDRFFLSYHAGRCTHQVIGINKFGAMPKQIAQYLGLPNAELFTGHSFRSTSAALYADSISGKILKRHAERRSNEIAEEYIEDSKNNKRKICDQITIRSIADQLGGCSKSEIELPISKCLKAESQINFNVSTLNNETNLQLTMKTPDANVTYNFANCNNVTIHLK